MLPAKIFLNFFGAILFSTKVKKSKQQELLKKTILCEPKRDDLT
jgi:hypothetical protein